MSAGPIAAVPGPVRAVFFAALLLFLGAAGLQQLRAAGRSDPVASVDNGGPRGWLLWWLALQAEGRDVARVRSDLAFAEATSPAAIPPEQLVIVVPPPEQTAFGATEATELRRHLDEGARVVVVCDPSPDRHKRLRSLLAGTGVRCVGEAELSVSSPRLVAPSMQLLLRDRGRVLIDEEAIGVLPLALEATDVDEGSILGAVVGTGPGELIVLGSATPLANDGLTEGDNAALVWWLARGRSRVVVDERHHLTRGAAVWQRASLQGAGPLTALLCVLLVIPLSLLAFAPRRGERTLSDVVTVPAAVVRVRGLAALLSSSSSSSLPLSSPSSPSSKSPRLSPDPPRPGARP